MYKFMYLFICCVLVFSFSIFGVFCKPAATKCKTKCCRDNLAVKNFQEFIRIDTSLESNLDHSVEFLRRQALELGLPFSVYYPAGKPICVITWTGADPSLPSIMLNSHADVVSVEEKFWTHPPFSAYIDENCNMFGRGTQDTKSVTIQYLEAIRKLIQKKVKLLRTLHVVVMPDEESGGFNGVKPFIKTKEFQSLNIGFALDEGLTSEDDIIFATYQDRRPWQMKFTVFGESGHGSGLPNGTAMEKMIKLLDIVMKFRDEKIEEKKKFNAFDFGASTSVNINVIKGGFAPNVIPSEIYAIIDMRLAVDANLTAIEAMVESWRTAVGNNTRIEYLRRDEVSAITPLDSNRYWEAMVQTAKDIGITLKPVVCPATSDMLVLRNAGIPALGFSPKVRTRSLIHAHDEYLPVDVFLEGIDIYVAMLKSLGNLSGNGSASTCR